jgi:hypothetical protein
MTYYVEQWKDKEGAYHFSKPSTTFNKALAKSKYGFKTIAVFKITPKPGIIINKA